MKTSNLVFLLMISIISLSCSNEKKETQVASKGITSPNEKSKEEFKFSQFQIGKGYIGKIKIGMTLREAEPFVKELTKQEIESYDVGFDGGGPAYLYSINEEPVLAILPAYDTDSIIALMAYHPSLRTSNGLHPKVTVAELLEKYPKISFYEDLLFSGEIAEDTIQKWSFNFNTDSLTQIGHYPKPEAKSKAFRKDIKVNWITVY